MSSAWSRATKLAARQHGVLSLRDATDLGLAPSTLYAWVRAGRLQRPVRRVFVVSGAPETWHQRVLVAARSSDAWASHTTAAALWELQGFRRGRVELLTLHGRRRSRAGWVTHETRHLRAVDLDEHGGVPCTSVARTVLDLPAVVQPYLVGRAMDDACRRWPGMLDQLVRRFLELPRRGRPGTRLLRAMLDERLGRGRFTQTDFETAALRLSGTADAACSVSRRGPSQPPSDARTGERGPSGAVAVPAPSRFRSGADMRLVERRAGSGRGRRTRAMPSSRMRSGCAGRDPGRPGTALSARRSGARPTGHHEIATGRHGDGHEEGQQVGVHDGVRTAGRQSAERTTGEDQVEHDMADAGRRVDRTQTAAAPDRCVGPERQRDERGER